MRSKIPQHIIRFFKVHRQHLTNYKARKFCAILFVKCVPFALSFCQCHLINSTYQRNNKRHFLVCSLTPDHISSSYFFIFISCICVFFFNCSSTLYQICNHFVSHFMKCRIRHFLFALLSFTHKMNFNALFSVWNSMCLKLIIFFCFFK